MASGIETVGANSLFVTYNLNIQQQRFSKLSEQLASGLSINSPADNPAVFTIAAHQETDAVSLDTASENIQTGTNQLNIASAAIQTVTGLVQQIRNLCVEASDSLLSTKSLTSLQLEIAQLNAEINHIGQSTQFDGVALLNTNNAPAANIVNAPSPPTLIQQTTEGAGATFTLPNAPATGNLLLLFVSYYGFTPPSAAPPGWTTVHYNSGSDIGDAIYSRVVAAGDPSSYSIGTQVLSGTLVEVHGANAANPVDGIADIYTTGTPYEQTSSITVPNAGDVAFGFLTNNDFPAVAGSGTVLGGANWSNVAFSNYSNYDSSDLQFDPLTNVGQSLYAGYAFQPTGHDYGFGATLLIAPTSLTSQKFLFQAGAQIGDNFLYTLPNVSAYALGTSFIDLTTLNGTIAAIQNCDTAITRLTSTQASIGSLLAALQQQNGINQTNSVNTIAAISNERDLNVAQATSDFTKASLLKNFGLSLLSQANLDETNVLSIFQSAGA